MAIDAVREDAASTKFAYALSGIGRDGSCNMQLVADSACTSPDQIRKLADEAVFNTIKVRLRTYKTISKAIVMCKAAKTVGWTVVIGADEGCSETSDSFITDFAVGVGASQLATGSLYSAEGTSKLNRLLDISRESEEIPFVGREFRKNS